MDLNYAIDRCITTLLYEEKSVEWIIENVSTIAMHKMPDLKFTFNAGDSIGVPSTWNIRLKFVSIFSLSLITDNDAHVNTEYCIKYASNVVYECLNRQLILRCNRPTSLGNFTFQPNPEDDTMSVSLKLTLYSNKVRNEVTPKKTDSQGIQELQLFRNISEDMQRLLDSGDNSDFVIKVPSDPQRRKHDPQRRKHETF